MDDMTDGIGEVEETQNPNKKQRGAQNAATSRDDENMTDVPSIPHKDIVAKTVPNSRNDEILIPDSQLNDKNTKQIQYLTGTQYAEKYNKNYNDFEEKKAVLIKKVNPNFPDDYTYMSKDQFKRNTFPGNEVGEVPKNLKDRNALQIANFEKKMGELGLEANESGRHGPDYSMSSEDRKFETPGGTRRKSSLKYKNPELAGDYNADILVQNKNGTFTGIWPKEQGMKQFSDALEQYGEGNIRLKTAIGNTYMRPERFDRSQNNLDAEQVFANMAGSVVHREKSDRPQFFYRTDKNTYKSKDQYDALANQPGSKLTKDPQKMDVIVQHPLGNGYLTPKTYKRLVGTEDAGEVFKKEGLPENLMTLSDKKKPKILVLSDPKTLVDGKLVLEKLKGAPILAAAPKANIYIQNEVTHGPKKGNGTENYRDVENFERRNTTAVAQAKLSDYGITSPPMAEKLSNAFKYDNRADRERERGVGLAG